MIEAAVAAAASVTTTFGDDGIAAVVVVVTVSAAEILSKLSLELLIKLLVAAPVFSDTDANADVTRLDAEVVTEAALPTAVEAAVVAAVEAAVTTLDEAETALDAATDVNSLNEFIILETPLL